MQPFDPSAPHLGEPAAPLPAEPPSEVTTNAAWWDVPLGFAAMVGCLETGEICKRWLGLILPGNILGLFLLLALLGAGVVPLRWVARTARWLLWLLPLLFMPVFVYALHNREFWLTDRGLFAGVVAAGTLLLWAATGHLAQWTLRRQPPSGRNDREPAP